MRLPALPALPVCPSVATVATPSTARQRRRHGRHPHLAAVAQTPAQTPSSGNCQWTGGHFCGGSNERCAVSVAGYRRTLTHPLLLWAMSKEGSADPPWGRQGRATESGAQIHRYLQREQRAGARPYGGVCAGVSAPAHILPRNRGARARLRGCESHAVRAGGRGTGKQPELPNAVTGGAQIRGQRGQRSACACVSSRCAPASSRTVVRDGYHCAVLCRMQSPKGDTVFAHPCGARAKYSPHRYRDCRIGKVRCTARYGSPASMLYRAGGRAVTAISGGPTGNGAVRRLSSASASALPAGFILHSSRRDPAARGVPPRGAGGRRGLHRSGEGRDWPPLGDIAWWQRVTGRYSPK